MYAISTTSNRYVPVLQTHKQRGGIKELPPQKNCKGLITGLEVLI